MIALTMAVELLLMIIVGMFSRKVGIVRNDFSGQLTSFIMKITLPAMIFNSVSSAMPFSWVALKNCLLVLLLSATVTALSLGIGQAFYLKSGRTGRGRILRYLVTFSSYSALGIPIIDALFGETGNMYYAFFIIPVRIFYYALSEPLMTPAERKRTEDVSSLLRNAFLSPSLIAVAVGLFFWVTGWALPPVLNSLIKQCGSLSSPLGLILCGIIIGNYDLKKLVNMKFVKVSLLRLLAMPALFYALTRPLLPAGVDHMICDMVVVYSALPAATLLPAYAIQYDPDERNQFEAAGICVVSTLLSTLTIPLWFYFLHQL